MSDNLTYWHLDGTQCVAGWDSTSGRCSEGGGEVMPRAFKNKPTTVAPVTVLMVALFDWERGIQPYGFFVEEHAASVLLRRLMAERGKMNLHPKSYFAVQPYVIGQEYGGLDILGRIDGR